LNTVIRVNIILMLCRLEPTLWYQFGWSSKVAVKWWILKFLFSHIVVIWILPHSNTKHSGYILDNILIITWCASIASKVQQSSVCESFVLQNTVTTVHHVKVSIAKSDHILKKYRKTK